MQPSRARRRHPFVCRNFGPAVPAWSSPGQWRPAETAVIARGRDLQRPRRRGEVSDRGAREHLADRSNASRKISRKLRGPRLRIEAGGREERFGVALGSLVALCLVVATVVSARGGGIVPGLRGGPAVAKPMWSTSAPRSNRECRRVRTALVRRRARRRCRYLRVRRCSLRPIRGPNIPANRHFFETCEHGVVTIRAQPGMPDTNTSAPSSRPPLLSRSA